TLGYVANWSRSEARDRGLEMMVGFAQADGSIPVEGDAPSQGLANAGDSLRDRRWNVGARYMFHPRADHQVSVRACTRLSQIDKPDCWILAPVQADFSMPSSGPRGWSMSLSGEDAWTVTEPLRLILGLDYRAWDGSTRISSIV